MRKIYLRRPTRTWKSQVHWVVVVTYKKRSQQMIAKMTNQKYRRTKNIYLSQEAVRCNFSLVTRYSLKFTHRSLFVAEVARCKISLVTRCRSCSLQNSLLLVAKFARYSLQKITHYLLQNSLVTRCEIRSLLIAKIHASLVMKKTRELMFI